MQTTRRHAREWAIQMLTAADLNPPEDIDLLIESFWTNLPTLSEDGQKCPKPGKKLKAFAEELVKGVLANLDGLDGELSTLLENWDL